MRMSSTFHLVWNALSLALIVPLGLLVLRFAWLYHILRRHPFIASRRPRVVLFSQLCGAIALLGYCVVQRVLLIASSLSSNNGVHYSPDYGFSDKASSPWDNLMFASLIVPMMLASVLLLVRFWLTYFATRESIASKDSMWIRHIDLNHCKERNWFVMHRDTWGNERFLTTRAIIAALMLCILLMTVRAVGNSEAASFIGAFFIVLEALALVWIRTHTPRFDDRILLRDEMRLLTAFLFSYAILVVAYAICGLFSTAAQRVVDTLVAVACSVGLLLQTWWVLLRLDLMPKRHAPHLSGRRSLSISSVHLRDHTLHVAVPSLSSPKPLKMTTLKSLTSLQSLTGMGLGGGAGVGAGGGIGVGVGSKAASPQARGQRGQGRGQGQGQGHVKVDSMSSSGSRCLSITDILSSEDGFRSFVCHVMEEFSAENLFCVVEVVLMMREHGVHVEVPLQLPGSVMRIKSTLLEEHRGNETQQAMAIADKYLLAASPYSVNLSYRCRRKAVVAHQDRSLEAMHEACHRVLEELFTLVNDSLSRYYNRVSYHLLARRRFGSTVLDL